jgi:hypothetical protein
MNASKDDQFPRRPQPDTSKRTTMFLAATICALAAALFAMAL